MPRVAKAINSSFILALGDNFYSAGVTLATDARFAETWGNVFTDESLMVPWYLCAGK
jgi:hypothetical protein